MVQKYGLQGTYVVGVEGERIRSPLGATPERLAGARDVVLRQVIEELTDDVVVLLLELQARPDDAFLKGEGLVRHEVRQELLDLLLLLAGVLEGALEVVGLRQVGIDSLRRLDEEVVEEGTTPLGTCKDLVSA